MHFLQTINMLNKLDILNNLTTNIYNHNSNNNLFTIVMTKVFMFLISSIYNN